MRTMNLKHPKFRAAALVLTGLLAGALMAGCESDSVAPHDELPTLGEKDVATQAGAVATAMVTVGPEVLADRTANKESYNHTFPEGSDIKGTIYLDYFLGGDGGNPAAWDQGDWAHVYTQASEWISIALGFQGTVILTFDITAAIDQPNKEATIGGGGTYRSGAYFAAYSFSDLLVKQSANYPESGSMTFTAAGFSMVVSYDGSNIAMLAIDGKGEYTVDLDTGEVTEIPEEA